MTFERTATMQIRMKPVLKENIERAAKVKGVTPSALARTILAKHFEKYGTG
jgi:hypothetical protein